MKKIFTLISFVLTGFSVSAQYCDLPDEFTGNTGSNMTIMLTSPFVSSLITDSADGAYIVALSSDGMIIGSSSVAGDTQTSLAIWGNDTSTDPIIDGALESELISFQLVNGSDLYDIEMPVSVTYSSNGLLVQPAPSIATTIADCSVLGCTDSSANNYDATANVDDASCTYDVSGCMDATANNYDATANVDDDSCTFDTPSGTAIEYQLSTGWNMVGYTGTPDNNGIVEQMDAALGNGSSTAETFQIIKDVTGKFWMPGVDLLPSFTPGQGYMAFVFSDADLTTVNFQQSSGYLSNISYQLTLGWNMFCFTGDLNAENGIVAAMNSALVNGSTTEETFQIIKDVTGKFWMPGVDLLPSFTPGEGYMAFVFPDADLTTVNFQQE